MIAINNIREIKSEAPSIRLVSVIAPTAEFTANSDVILAYQVETEKLQGQITRLKHENSILVKWLNYLF